MKKMFIIIFLALFTFWSSKILFGDWGYCDITITLFLFLRILFAVLCRYLARARYRYLFPAHSSRLHSFFVPLWALLLGCGECIHLFTVTTVSILICACAYARLAVSEWICFKFAFAWRCDFSRRSVLIFAPFILIKFHLIIDDFFLL